MSDSDKTIDGFAYWIENEENGVCYIPLNLCEKIMKLLKEQEPMMVRLTASTIRCPKCGKQITSRGAIHREIKFCWKCGQAVKWE